MKALIRYRYTDMMKGVVAFWGVMLLIVAVIACIETGEERISFSAYGFSTVIMLFVLGICAIREDVRLAAQCGVGRRSAFLGNLITLLTVAGTMAAAGEVFVGTAQVVLGGRPNIFLFDLYQMLYVGADQPVLTMGQHAMSMIFVLMLGLCAAVWGSFFSLLFWRLNKFWTVVVAVAIPVLANGVPYLAIYLAGEEAVAEAGLRAVGFLMQSPWNFIAVLAALSAAGIVVNWLLLRRAAVKAAK
ncbi:hypothetical protein H8790_01160 [Oscillibacter hominis]|uniref:Uncharacterized protein n=1 Tax=Oscillibacter hominis TaxID=2763056 RepID=A0A7G9B563_9FIRM|nr:hypothetical protein [Oscillibacter hominis]QNL44694.1 hypothetical protein H8790_01160 [Oscillibacter hominis]